MNYIGGNEIMHPETTMKTYIDEQVFQILSRLYKQACDINVKYDLPTSPLGMINVQNLIIYTSSTYNETLGTTHTLELIENSRDLNQLYTCKSLQILNRIQHFDCFGEPVVKVIRVPVSLHVFLYVYVDIYKNVMTGEMLDYIVTLLKKSKLNNGRDKIIKTYFDYIASVMGYSKGNLSPTALLEALKELCLDENYVYANTIYDNSHKTYSVDSIAYMDGCMEHIINNLMYMGANKFHFTTH